MALTLAKTDAAERPEFGAFVTDDITMELLAPAARDHGWSKESVRTGGIASAVRTLTSSPCPNILIVDISDSIDPRSDMTALAEVCEVDTAVMVIGTQNDATLFRDLLNAGVQDYLVKPVSAEMLFDALGHMRTALEAQPAAPEEQLKPEERRTIVTVGLRGGLGTSTLAVHLAAGIAARPMKTLLLDMDLHFGVAALMFDLEAGRGLVDALENPSRVDGLFLERAVVKPTSQLSILAAEAPIGTGRPPENGALTDLIGVLGDSFGTQIIDLPRHQLANNLDALEAATDIVLVTDLSLCGARDSIRLIGHLEKVLKGVNVHVIASKTGAQGGEVDRADFENSIEKPLLGVIPNDPKAFLNASKAGKTLFDTAPSSKAAQAYKQIAEALVPRGEHDEKSGGGFLASLFARKS